MKSMNKLTLSILTYLLLLLSIPLDIHASNTDTLPWYITDTGVPDLWKQLQDAEPTEDVIVAVIDTGIDYTHPALSQALWKNAKEANGKEGIDDDGNGYVDDIYGINTIHSSSKEPTGDPFYDTHGIVDDYSSHGTHIAGIIAQIANVDSDCNPYHIKIMSIRAGDSQGNFDFADIIAAIDYATTMGADIINLSFGTTDPSQELISATEEASKDCIIVAAAGNAVNAKSVSTKEQDSLVGKNIYPAALPYVLGVMYHEESHHLANASNWDALADTDFEYELSAPGAEITSTMPNGSYASKSGTSMAAGFVSGSVALLLQAQRQYDPQHCSLQQVQSILLSSCPRDITKTEGTITPLTFRRLQLSDYAKTLTNHMTSDTSDPAYPQESMSSAIVQPIPLWWGTIKTNDHENSSFNFQLYPLVDKQEIRHKNELPFPMLTIPVN